MRTLPRFIRLSFIATAGAIATYGIQHLQARLTPDIPHAASVSEVLGVSGGAPTLPGESVPLYELNGLPQPAHIHDPAAAASVSISAQAPMPVGGSWHDVDKHIRNTVVQVFSYVAQFNWLEPYKTPDQAGATGTAFFISPDGLMITNAHVVNQAVRLCIQIPSLGKEQFDVELIGISPERDLALLRIKDSDKRDVVKGLGTIPYLTFANSDEVHRADQAMALGYPLGQQSLKSTTGVVSGVEHIGGRSMIQISAPINPGNSGGPCLNERGEVIGVNTAGIMENGTQNVGYIIPANEVQLFLKQLEHAEVTASGVKLLRKPYLGIMYQGATEVLVHYMNNPLPGGAYVNQVFKGGLLEKAGMQVGDMIYSIDGYPVDRFYEMDVPWSQDKIQMGEYFARTVVGQPVTIKVYRQGKPLDITFTIGTDHQPAIRVWYPGYETIDYEVLAGAVVMPLTLNHVAMMMNQVELLVPYADASRQTEPALIITHILPDSLMSRSRLITAGTLIDEINGQKVQTLQEFRAAVSKGAPSGYMTLKTKDKRFAAFQLARVFEEEPRLARMFFYDVSPLVNQLKDITPRV